MNNNKILNQNTKPGKKFSGFCFVILFGLYFSSLGQTKNLIEIKGYVFDREDSSLVSNVNIIGKLDTFLLSVKTDSFGFYSFQINKNQFKKIVLYTQTNKYVKTETAAYGFLATDFRHIIDLSKDSIAFEYNFQLQRVWACGGPNLRLLFKKNEAVLLDSVREFDYISEKDSVRYYYRKPADDILKINKLLENDPTIIIELSGHSSFDEKDPKLSDDSALAIKQMVVAKGIPADRIIAKGYRSTKLKISNGMIAKAKSKEEKNALHQINRRVVFKILSFDYPLPTGWLAKQNLHKYKPKKK